MGEPRLREVGKLVQGHPAGTEVAAVEVGRFMCAALPAQLLALPRNPPSCIQSLGLATGQHALSHEPFRNVPQITGKIEESDFLKRETWEEKAASPRGRGPHTLLMSLELHNVELCPCHWAQWEVTNRSQTAGTIVCAHVGHMYTLHQAHSYLPLMKPICIHGHVHTPPHGCTWVRTHTHTHVHTCTQSHTACECTPVDTDT